MLFQINLIDEISDDPIKFCQDEMIKWLAVPDYARSLTKLQNRGEIIERMKKGRREDVEKLINYVPKEGIQKTLGNYLSSLKNKKK